MPVGAGRGRKRACAAATPSPRACEVSNDAAWSGKNPAAQTHAPPLSSGQRNGKKRSTGEGVDVRASTQPASKKARIEVPEVLGSDGTLAPWPSRRSCKAPAPIGESTSDADLNADRPAGRSGLRSAKQPARPGLARCVVVLPDSKATQVTPSRMPALEAYTTHGQTSAHVRRSLQASKVHQALPAWPGCSAMMPLTQLTAIHPAAAAPAPAARSRALTISPFDKLFSSAWLDSDTVVAGTKCGSVLRIKRKTLKIEAVSVFDPDVKVGRPNAARETLPFERSRHSGIHTVTPNPSCTRLAVSGHHTVRNAAYILDLECQSWRTLHRADGHSDWVFSLAWLSDTTFVTASRDTNVMLWDLNASRARTHGYDLKPQATYKNVHKARVRCMAHDAATQRLATCDTNGVLMLWDPVGRGDMRVQRKMELGPQLSFEVCCMRMSADMLAVGSRRAVTLYDPRMQGTRPLAAIAMPLEEGEEDHGDDYPPCYGVRSVDMCGPLLSAGCTDGSIFILDRRMLGAGLFSSPSRTAPGIAPRWLVATTPAAPSLTEHAEQAAPRPRPRRGTPLSNPAILSNSAVELPSWASRRDRTNVQALRAYEVEDLMPQYGDLPVGSLFVPHCTFTRHEPFETEDGYDVHGNSATAVYTHTWNPEGSSLFVGGGPLVLVRRGCYVGFAG